VGVRCQPLQGSRVIPRAGSRHSNLLCKAPRAPDCSSGCDCECGCDCGCDSPPLPPWGWRAGGGLWAWRSPARGLEDAHGVPQAPALEKKEMTALDTTGSMPCPSFCTHKSHHGQGGRHWRWCWDKCNGQVQLYQHMTTALDITGSMPCPSFCSHKSKTTAKGGSMPSSARAF